MHRDIVVNGSPQRAFHQTIVQSVGVGIVGLPLIAGLLCLGSAARASDGTGGGGDQPARASSSAAASARPYGFQYFVGIVGSPSKPEIDWSDEDLRQIKELGVNMLQLSIAWGTRPANEVLNLEDLTEEQLAKWRHRVSQAKKFGFSTIAHFGVPKALHISQGIYQPACILAPEVREKYTRLLGEFLDRFPDVENVLFYTYDQDAWQCSEFGPCPRCSGIPLDERLSGFLDLMSGVMQKHHPGSTLWWKPWEISNGQLTKIIQSIQAAHFGLVLNPSSANEVYAFNDRSFASDLGIKRAVQVAADRGIPVIGEFDYTFYKGYYAIDDYCPRFVYENLQGWKQMTGVVGIKEYFGLAPSDFSVNAAMLKACIRTPNASLEELLGAIATPYGQKAAPFMIEAWEKVARGIEAFPWGPTVLIGSLGLNKGNDGSHNWEPVTIPNGTWSTPSWKTNRRANFMLTEDFKAHPWLFEDVGLHLEDSGTLLFEAVSALDKAIAGGGPKADDIRMQRTSIAAVARAVCGKGLHFLETLAAHEARLVGNDAKQQAVVLKRLEKLLVKDVENQGNAAAVVQKLEEFRKDPKAWLKVNLNPRAYESNCTIDWNRFEPVAR